MTNDRRDDKVLRRAQPLRRARRLRFRLAAHGLLLVLAAVAAAYALVAPDGVPGNGRRELIAGSVADQGFGVSRSLTGGSREALQPGSLAGPESAAQRLGAPNFGSAVQNGLCEPGDTDAYCVYTVKEGDTLSGIAELFDLNGGVVPGWELLAASNQPDIVDVDDFIQPGQKLRVPLARGVVHTILLDETVSALAQQFDVTTEQIIVGNRLTNPDLLATGDVIFIPEPGRLPSPDVAGPAGEASPAPQSFIWPITATVRITNYMTDRHPLGIDMGLSHAAGSPIVAVMDGVVEFAGGNACCTYGLYVILDHGNGLKTLYAHLSALEVARGQHVSQGQRLGPSGSTGYSTGVHLHFEVYQDGKRRNPIDYLP
jgi:murein DD-endopeptidase MepM/ murein hydrolase activator NlpD